MKLSSSPVLLLFSAAVLLALLWAATGFSVVVRNKARCPAAHLTQSNLKQTGLCVASGNSDEEEEKKLTPEKVAELIEVSFVSAVMQLSQGYVDVLKLFIAAVQSGYALKLSPAQLLRNVAECPVQSANRPLMDEELQLRATWVQVVYLVLDQVGYQGKRLIGDSPSPEQDVDHQIREVYAPAIAPMKQAKDRGEAFESEKMLSIFKADIPTDPLEKALLSQTLRVIWVALTVLEEEAQCIEDKKPFRSSPKPPIPGAFD